MEEREEITAKEAASLLGYLKADIIYELFHDQFIEGYQIKKGGKILLFKDSVLQYKKNKINSSTEKLGTF